MKSLFFGFICLVFLVACQSKRPDLIIIEEYKDDPTQLDSGEVGELDEYQEIRESIGYPYDNIDEMIRELRLSLYYDVALRAYDGRPEIAILDNGFSGIGSEIGRTLPADSCVVRFKDRRAVPGSCGKNVGRNNHDPHGTYMALLISALMTANGKYPQLQPRFYFYEAKGFSRFDSAVRDAVQRKVDFILYAQVWQFGGNGDGEGFVNKTVSAALSDPFGPVWVNASGNFGQTTFRKSIRKGFGDRYNPAGEVSSDQNPVWAELSDPQHNSVKMQCMENTANNNMCDVEIVLAWNDFKDDISQGTTKDLDLELFQVIQSNVDGRQQLVLAPTPFKSSWTQVGAFTGNMTTRTHSLYPFERIEARIPPGLYHIKVRIKSDNFDPYRDWLRITAKGDFIGLLDRTEQETLLPPADNFDVITVGANDTARTSRSFVEGKPNTWLTSHVEVKTGEGFRGSSIGAAKLVAALATMKSINVELDREEFFYIIERRTRNLPGMTEGHRRGRRRTNIDARNRQLKITPGAFVMPTPSF